MTASPSANNPLSRKLNKILNQNGATVHRGDSVGLSPELVETLRGLSDVFHENTPRARRNLRGNLERRMLVINTQFKDAFSHVQEKLERVQTDIDHMAVTCTEMTQRLNDAQSETRELLTQTSQLRSSVQRVTVQAGVLDMFLKKFQLSEDERDALHGDEVTPSFFGALARAQKIHDECKSLLRTNQQQAGLTIMESMAALQEAAFEKLYRWTQSACRSLTSDSPDAPALLCRAMHSLRARPILFQYSLNELSTARRNAVVRSFIDALTRGKGNAARPIELFAHDSVRYTSDMLAWLHQCAASEREFVKNILVPPADGPKYRRTLPEALTEEAKAQLEEAMDKITEGACRPFKVRVEQVLSGLVPCYRTACVLEFYGHTIAELTKPTAALPALLEELRGSALKIFFDALNVHANNLLVNVELPPGNLSPPETLERTLTVLRDILSSQDSSLAATQIKQAELEKVLSCVLEPLVQMCAVSASNLPAADMAVYMINCLYRIQSTLMVYDNTETRVEALEEQVNPHADALVDEQFKIMALKAGLLDVFTAHASWQAGRESDRLPASKYAGLHPEALQKASSRLDQFLASADFAPIAQINLLLSSRIRTSINEKVLAHFADQYTALHATVQKLDNEYPISSSLLRRTPDQVQALLK
eukprot:m.169099 g.169099  ORF g.169099 m.169099 type:complete len:652 (-) comp25102_c0_seq3:54-2009(-)